MNTLIRYGYFVCLLTLCSTVSAINNGNSSRAGEELLKNGSFELDVDFDGKPDNWHIMDPGRRACNFDAYLGVCSLISPAGSLKKAKQKVDIAGSNDDNFWLEFWSKLTGEKTYQKAHVKARFKCTDGSSIIYIYFFKT